MSFLKPIVLGVFICLFAPACLADTIAFFYALDKDFEGFKTEARSVGQSLKVGSRSLAVLQIGSHRVYAVKMGSGAVETAVSAQVLLARAQCDEAFSIGPVGALSDKLKIGAWYQVGEVIAYQKGSWTKTGFQLSASATADLTNAPVGKSPGLFQKRDSIKIASGEIFVASDNYRAQLHEITGADAVDMNLFGLTTVCEDHKLSVYCWRIVSDHANNNASDDFKKFVANYDGAGGKAIAEIIKNLPANPNSPDAYPNLRGILSKPAK